MLQCFKTECGPVPDPALSDVNRQRQFGVAAEEGADPYSAVKAM